MRERGMEGRKKGEREKRGEGRSKRREEQAEGGQGERKIVNMHKPIPSLSLLCATVNKFSYGNTANQFYYSMKHLKPIQSIF